MKYPILRLLIWPTVLITLSSAASACFVPRFEPTDKGGTFLVVAVKTSDERMEQSVEQVMNVFKERCRRLDIYCKAERQGGAGSNRIMLRVSGAKDIARVKSILLAEGMKLCAVVSPPNPSPIQSFPTRESAAAEAGANAEVLPYSEDGIAEGFLIVEREPIVDGNDIRYADAVPDGYTGGTNESGYSVNFTLRPAGAERFGVWTAANINRYLAVIVNGKVHSAPYIRAQITDNGVITGAFTKEQAEDTALVLMSGNLPAPVEVLEEGTYKP